MKNFQLLFITVILSSCHQPLSQKMEKSISDTTLLMPKKNDTNTTSLENQIADTVGAEAPEMLMLNNERGDLAVFCVYGAELVTVVPSEKHGLEELLKHPETILDMTVRSKVKMSGSNDIAHALWVGKCTKDYKVILKTPVENDSLQVLYSFKGDTIYAASSIRKDNGHSMSITTKHFWRSGSPRFNTIVQTVNQQLIEMMPL